MSAGQGRVLGWDLLRGLCALSVMAYHLMGWEELAHVSTLGTYGVYLFFLLSGASLGYVYEPSALLRPAGFARFLATRWLRLAPLYLALCLPYLAMLAAHLGGWGGHLPLRLALNASFAFGLHDPATWALLIGGWSLGIECAFYLALPIVLWLLRRPVARWALLAGAVALQAAWVLATVGRHGLAAATVGYHQVPAFAGYFVAGCLIGQERRRPGPALTQGQGAIAWALLGSALLLAAPAEAGDELVGWRGLLLPGLCAAAVWASGRVLLRGRAAGLAAWLGDITYGAYLLHPMLFFALAWFVLPGPVEALPLWARLALLAGVAVATCALAVASERHLERPLREAGRRWLRRPGPQSDSASIAS